MKIIKPKCFRTGKVLSLVLGKSGIFEHHSSTYCPCEAKKEIGKNLKIRTDLEFRTRIQLLAILRELRASDILFNCKQLYAQGSIEWH